MEKETNKSSLERRLASKEAQIKQRIDGLESEIVSTPAAVRAAIRKNPWLGVGAAVAAGAVVGLIFGGRKKNSAVAPAHQALIEGYISAVADEVRKGVRRGKDPEEVVRKTLKDRSPIIVYAPEKVERVGREPKGFLREVGDLTMKTALGFAVKTALDFFTASLNVKELQNIIAIEEEERRSGEGAPRTPGGDGSSDVAPVKNDPIDH